MAASAPSERLNYLVPNEPRWPIDPARPVIELRGVQKRFGDAVVLDGLDLAVETGKTTVVAGQSGSGKSVLLKLMNGLLLPDEGQVLLFGEDTRQVPLTRLLELRKRVTMMFQNYALMDSLTVSQNIGFPLYVNGSMRWREIQPLVDELLELLDLQGAGGKMPSELSGGMKKRVSLARAVVSNPEVVLFDEPTTGLDPVMIEFVDQLIRRTRERYGITSVIISHDTTSILGLADRLAMLEHGRIQTLGSVDEVRATGEPLVEAFFGGAGRRLTAGESATEAEAAARRAEVEPAVEVVDLYKSFGPHQVLRGVDLSIPKNRITVLIGGSGSGKSVIMKHIIGIFKPDRGQVLVFGRDITQLDDAALLKLRTHFGMLFQGAALLDGMTVAENVSFPLKERGLAAGEVRDRTAQILDQLKLTGIAKRYPADISNGQKKRVGLARAIVTQPRIMIYDEPTTGQDPVMTRYVDDMIVEAQELFDITSIVVSHDMASTFRVAHQVAMLYRGEIRAVGTPDEVRASPDPQVRRFIFAGTPEGDAAARELGEA